jgi:hypothetical protein
VWRIRSDSRCSPDPMERGRVQCEGASPWRSHGHSTQRAPDGRLEGGRVPQGFPRGLVLTVRPVRGQMRRWPPQQESSQPHGRAVIVWARRACAQRAPRGECHRGWVGFGGAWPCRGGRRCWPGREARTQEGSRQAWWRLGERSLAAARQERRVHGRRGVTCRCDRQSTGRACERPGLRGGSDVAGSAGTAGHGPA